MAALDMPILGTFQSCGLAARDSCLLSDRLAALCRWTWLLMQSAACQSLTLSWQPGSMQCPQIILQNGFANSRRSMHRQPLHDGGNLQLLASQPGKFIELHCMLWMSCLSASLRLTLSSTASAMEYPRLS